MAQITPTDTTGYRVTRILAVIEEVQGTIPENPVCVEMKAENFSVDITQADELIKLLSDWDAGKKAYGTTSVAGSAGVILSIENAPFLIQTTVGTRLTTANATATPWTTATVFAVGDIVNSADGLHTLVCTTAGTTGAATEAAFVPNLAANPKDDQGTKIADGATVTWMAMPLYKQDTFAISQFLKTFTIEVEYKTPTGELFYQRMSNCYMGGLPMSMSGGTISAKASLSLKGTTLLESTDPTWDESLSAKTGAKVCLQEKDFYDYESFNLKIDGVVDCAESAELSLARDATVKDLISGCKDVNIGTPMISGTFNRVFSTQANANAANHTQFSAVFEFIKSNGCQLILTYPNVVPELGKITSSTEEKAYLSNTVNAHGTSAQVSVTANIIYPSHVDTTGALADPLA